MQRNNFNISLISILSATLLIAGILLIGKIGIGLSFAKSAGPAADTSAKKMRQIFGTEAPSLKDADFQAIKSYIDAFFLYVDNQPYMQAHQSFKGSRRQYLEIIELFAENFPAVTRETDSLADVSKNVFYFYRVLGKERILLLKDVLIHESDIIEPLMNCFYQWLIHDTANSDPEKLRLSIQQLCGYSGFFLETFGGRSYLLRRSAKVQTLISYYCTLIINKADEEGYNPYGLDIRPHLALVFDNLVQQKGLDYKSQYLNKLGELKKTYHM